MMLVNTGSIIFLGMVMVLVLWAIISRVKQPNRKIQTNESGGNARPSASFGPSPQVIAAISSAVLEFRKDNGRG